MPACIICKADEGDVKKGLKESRRRSKGVLDLLKKSELVSVMQVGTRKYHNLEKASQDDVIKEIEKKHITHILNYKTLTIHKKDCPHAGKNILKGYIVNPEVTGLRRCRHCMP